MIDVTDPANPQIVGNCDTSGYAYSVAVSGNHAYVADWDAGLQLIDISNPANPQRAGGCDTSGSARSVAVNGSYVFVADGPWGLTVLGPCLRISSIVCTAGTATVYYTNTIPGMNYTLEYRTNLVTGNWQPLGTLTATGAGDFQTDNAASSAQRFYRISSAAQ